jgi:hypothetical protein
MNDEDQAVRDFPRKPTVVHRGPASIEDLLQHVDPAPDEDTERFIAAIYADRRDAGAVRPRE